MKLQKPKGTEDLLPATVAQWRHAEEAFREILRQYGFGEIRTPMYERVGVFDRTAGDTSEIVTKQMFRVEGTDCVLKPESTAPAMRALIEAGQAAPGVVQRVAYVSSAHFRHENPQAGRKHQHHQCGVELVGVAGPRADAEIIEIFMRFLESLGIDDAVVSLNTLGREACRETYREKVLAHFADYVGAMKPEDAERARKNPLRLLDSKDANAQDLIASAPPIYDDLEPDSKARFEELQGLLRDAGVKFEVDPRIVRGLDYYTDTVFEVLRPELGAQSAVGAGGRYDGVVKSLGGPALPAVGFGIGMERLMIVLEKRGYAFPTTPPPVFLVSQFDGARARVTSLARELRAAGVAVVTDLEGNSLKSQMRQADKVGARFVVILGEEELQNGQAVLKDMESGEQQTLRQSDLEAKLREG